MRRCAVLMMLAACGVTGRHTKNNMISSAVPLAELRAPHIMAIVRSGDGINRVWLDTGIASTIPGGADTFVIDTDTTVYIEHGMYVIRRAGESQIEIDGATKNAQLALSPDGAHVAAITGANELALVASADLRVQRVALPFSFEGDTALRWDSPAMLLARRGDTTYAIAVPAGTVTPGDSRPWKVTMRDLIGIGTEKLTCPRGGVQIERREKPNRVDLVLVPLAGAANPEMLGAIAPRVLVSATDYESPWHGDGAYHLGKPVPSPLTLDAVTPDCRYILFTHERRVYVVEIASGRYAALANGRSAEIPRVRPPP